MTLISWNDLFHSDSPPLRGVSATMGVFDGLHLGHQALLNQLKTAPSPRVVLSFKDNPKAMLHPGQFEGALMSEGLKQELLAQAGVDVLVHLDFSPDFRKMTGREFFRRLLSSVQLIRFIVGYDFSFGYQKETRFEELRTILGPEVSLLQLPPVSESGEIVSSRLIRQRLLEGDLPWVVRALGRPYLWTVPWDQVHVEADLCRLVRHHTGQVLPREGRWQAGTHDGKRTQLSFLEDSVTWEWPYEDHPEHFILVSKE